MSESVLDASKKIIDKIGDFIVTLGDEDYERGRQLQDVLEDYLSDLESDMDAELREARDESYSDGKRDAEEDAREKIKQIMKDSYVDGFAYAVKLYSPFYNGTNGYETLGMLENHLSTLQLWQIGTTTLPPMLSGALES